MARRASQAQWHWPGSSALRRRVSHCRLGQPQPALASLSAALAKLPPGALAPLLKACAPRLAWTVGDFKMPASFAGRSAYVEIVGPEGLAHRHDLRFGLYLQTPESLYPPHNHAAEELYYVLSGTARWQKADGEFHAKSPGTLIRHAPWERHAMKTAARTPVRHVGLDGGSERFHLSRRRGLTPALEHVSIRWNRNML